MASQQELENLVVRLIGDGSSYQAMMKQASTSTQQIAQQASRATRQVQGVGFRLDQFGQTVFSAMSMMGVSFSSMSFLQSAVNMAAEAEQMEISFGTMLGGIEQGKQMVADLQRFAAATPFDMGTIQRATQILLQFGAGGDEVVSTLRMIGDVTGGTDPQKVMSMALAFGQMSSTGRLMGQDLLQMINAGFNPLEEMTRTTGKSMGELKAMMEKGQISLQMVKDAFKSATSDGGKFSGMMDKQSRSLTGLISTMQDDFAGVMRIIGKEIIERLRLKELVAMMSQAAQAVQNFLLNIPEGVKSAITYFAIFAGSVVALFGSLVVLELFMTPLITAFKGAAANMLYLGRVVRSVLNPIRMIGMAFSGVMAVVSGIGAVFATVFSPIGLLIAAAVAVVGTFISKMGGLAGAWEVVKGAAATAWAWISERTLAFIEWARPIAVALSGFFTTAWGLIQEGVLAVWGVAKSVFATLGEFVSSVWTSIAGSATVNWNSVRDTILSTILFAEYTLKNFGQVATYAFTSALLSFVQWGNQIQYFFTTVMPALFSWFTNNWRDIFSTAYSYASNVINNLGRNIVAVFTNIPGLISGRVRFDQIWTPLLQGAQNTIREMPNIPERVMGDMERELQASVDRQADILGSGFENFRRQRMAEINRTISQAVDPNSDAARVAYRQGSQLGQQLGKNVAKGAAQEAGKLDAVLRFSSEALSRLADWRDKLAAKPQISAAPTGAALPVPPMAPPANVPAPNVPAPPAGVAPAPAAVPPAPAPPAAAPPGANLPNLPNHIRALIVPDFSRLEAELAERYRPLLIPARLQFDAQDRPAPPRFQWDPNDGEVRIRVPDAAEQQRAFDQHGGMADRRVVELLTQIRDGVTNRGQVRPVIELEEAEFSS